MGSKIMLLTERAIEKLLLAQKDSEAFGIRIGVKSGGCSGKSYYMEPAASKMPYDEVIEQQGVRILIDPKALMYLIGTTMDYQEEEFKSGFTFSNPNEKGKCGCGESFSV